MVNTYTKQLEELFPFYLNVNGTKTFLKTIQPKYWKLFFDTLKNGPEINSNHDEPAGDHNQYLILLFQ